MAIGASFDEVLLAARQGAEWAWVELYRDLAVPVENYLARRGADEAQDLASETFLQVARGIQSYSGDESAFRSWVFVIAHRRLQDERRKAGRRPREASLDDVGSRVDEPISQDDAESEALSRMSLDEVKRTLGVLTPEQRDVLLLRVVAGLSLKEAATVMGKKPNAVKALQHRALIALHQDMFPSA